MRAEGGTTTRLAIRALPLIAQAGGWAEESGKWTTEVCLAYPDSGFIRLGVQLSSQPIDSAKTLANNVQTYEYLDGDEKKDFTVSSVSAFSPSKGLGSIAVWA